MIYSSNIHINTPSNGLLGIVYNKVNGLFVAYAGPFKRLVTMLPVFHFE